MELDLEPPLDDGNSYDGYGNQETHIGEVANLLRHLHGNFESREKRAWESVQNKMFANRTLPNVDEREHFLWYLILLAFTGSVDEMFRSVHSERSDVLGSEHSFDLILEDTLAEFVEDVWFKPVGARNLPLEKLLTLWCRSFKKWWRFIEPCSEGFEVEILVEEAFLRRFGELLILRRLYESPIAVLVPPSWNYVDSKLESWIGYVERAQNRIYRKIPFESFSLDEIYIDLRASYLEIDQGEHQEARRVGVQLIDHVLEWVEEGQSQNSMLSIAGASGSGKSSFCEIFTARQAMPLFEKGVTTIHIPVSQLSIDTSFELAIEDYLCKRESLAFNPLHRDYLKTRRTLLVLDDLEKLPMPANRRRSVSRSFVSSAWNLCERVNKGRDFARLQIVFTGNPHTIQSCSDLFTGQSLLEILPFYPGSQRARGWWPEDVKRGSKFLQVDQRRKWWERWGDLTGEEVSDHLSIIDSFGAEELAQQPFFNYVVAHAKLELKIDFSGKVSLLELYNSLIAYMLDEIDSGENIDFDVLYLCLEEIAVWVWRGRKFDLTAEELHERLCRSPFLRKIHGEVDSRTTKAIHRVLETVFGAKDLGALYQAFQRYLFGDYFVATRLVRVIRFLVERTSGDEAKGSWDLDDSLLLWAEETSEASIHSSIFQFLRVILKDVLEELPEASRKCWQSVVSEMFSAIVVDGFPMERVSRLSSFQEMSEGESNSGTALVSVLGGIASVTGKVSSVEWHGHQSQLLGSWLLKMNGQHADYLSASLGMGVSQLVQSPLILQSLSYLNFSRQILTVQNLSAASLNGALMTEVSLDRSSLRYADLRGAHLERSQISQATLNHADLRSANFDRSNLTGARMEYCRLEGASLIRAKLNEANFSHAKMSNSSLSWSKMNGAVLKEAVLDEARLNGVEMNGSNLTNASLRGVVFDGVTATRIIFDGSSLIDASAINAILNQGSFNGSVLKNACLYQSEMKEANFLRCQMQEVNLESCDLSNSIFRGCDLSGASLSNADLGKVTFKSACSLHGTSLNGAKIRGALFQKADLKMATFERAQFSETSRFIDCNLTGADFSEVDLGATEMEGCVLERTTFIDAKMVKADLKGADFRRAVMDGADLSEAVLQKVNFSDASLFRVNMKHAKLSHSILKGANLHGAILENAILNHSDLSGVSLFGASLVGANLRKADLTGASLFGANFEGARIHEDQLSDEQKDQIRGAPKWIYEDEEMNSDHSDSLDSLTIVEVNNTMVLEEGLLVEDREMVTVTASTKQDDERN